MVFILKIKQYFHFKISICEDYFVTLFFYRLHMLYIRCHIGNIFADFGSLKSDFTLKNVFTLKENHLI